MFTSVKKVSRQKESELKFSFLIPSWNNLDFLQLCIKSIQKNSEYKHQLIIIINEGSDGTLEWVKSKPELDYVHCPKNIGICYGLNSARSLIKTDYVLYANDDMYFLPAWDTELLKEIESIDHKEFMLSSTMIEPDDTGNPCVIVADYGSTIADFKEEKLLTEYSTYNKTDWNGSTWPPNIMPIELWDLVGGMSTEFSPGFYSDPDLSMKLWQAGVRYFKGVAASRVYHFGSKSTKRAKMNKGKDIFLKKWGISSNFFTTKKLKRGTAFQGVLNDYTFSAKDKIVNLLKRIKSVV